MRTLASLLLHHRIVGMRHRRTSGAHTMQGIGKDALHNLDIFWWVNPKVLNAHLVEHVPDGCAGLVDRGHDGVAHGCKARHVLHDIECGKGVQSSCRFVQEQQGRLSYQRTCYAQPPLLPSCISTTSLGNATGLYESVVSC